MKIVVIGGTGLIGSKTVVVSAGLPSWRSARTGWATRLITSRTS